MTKSARTTLVNGGMVVLVTLLVAFSAKAERTLGPNGTFDVSWFEDGEWRSLGRVEAGQELRVFDLGAIDAAAAARVVVRVEKRGGGLAHLDRLTVGGRGPIEDGSVAAAKLSRSDLDVVDATEPLDLVFDMRGLAGPVGVELEGRIEAAEISKVPFRFPAANTYGEIDEIGWFYRYELGAAPGALAIDGALSNERLGAPFLVETFPVGSGHPEGDTFVWVMNDADTLYVAMDFTPDNTVDDGADYASVHVRTEAGTKTYTVSASRTEHGVQGFVYTDKVAYQHMVYELAIPLDELGAHGGAGALEIAFSAYGTASPLQQRYYIEYNPNANEYMVVYSRWNVQDEDVFGQLFDADGNPIGDEIEIAIATSNQMAPNLAFDAVNDRYLVVWVDYRNQGDFHQLWGQMVNSDGSLVDHDGDTVPEPADDNLDFGIPVDNTLWPDIEYNPATGGYLVSYLDDSWDISVAPIAADGTAGTAQRVSLNEIDYYSADLAVDPSSGGAFALYADDSEGIDMYYRLVGADATPVSGESYLDWGEYGNYPAVVFGESVGEYFAVRPSNGDGWANLRYYTFDTDGLPLDHSVELPLTDHYNFFETDVAWDSVRERYVLVWDRDADEDWYPETVRAQYIETDGGLSDPDAGVELTALDGGLAVRPEVAFNSECANFAVAYSTIEGGFGYEVAVVGGCVGVAAGPASGPTTEAGGTATIPVSLNARPTAPVVFDVQVDDATELQVDPATLTFTSADWSVAKEVTVTGVDDTALDGDVASDVTFDVTSADGAYDGWLVTPVSVTNQDDDVGGFTVGAISGPVSEAGTQATFTVALTGAPNAEVTLSLTSSDPQEGTVSPASLAFTEADWDTAKTVTVTGVDDDEVDGTQTFTIVTGAAASSDPVFDGVNPPDVAASNLDDDSPAPSPPTLDWLPGANVGVTPVSGPAGTKFAFGVVYTSPDDLPPTLRNLHIDFDGDGEQAGAVGALSGEPTSSRVSPIPAALLILTVLAVLALFSARSRAAVAVAAAGMMAVVLATVACGEKDEEDDDAAVCDGEDGTTEVFDLVEIDASDTDYTDGKAYGIAMSICATGDFDYTFSFSDGAQDATGAPSSPHAFTVEPL